MQIPVSVHKTLNYALRLSTVLSFSSIAFDREEDCIDCHINQCKIKLG